MEDNLHFLANWKTTSMFLKIEDQWCVPRLGEVLTLAFKGGSQGWVERLGHKFGSEGWVSRLVSRLWYPGYVSRLGSKTGYHVMVQRLGNEWSHWFSSKAWLGTISEFKVCDQTIGSKDGYKVGVTKVASLLFVAASESWRRPCLIQERQKQYEHQEKQS